MTKAEALVTVGQGGVVLLVVTIQNNAEIRVQFVGLNRAKGITARARTLARVLNIFMIVLRLLNI